MRDLCPKGTRMCVRRCGKREAFSTMAFHIPFAGLFSFPRKSINPRLRGSVSEANVLGCRNLQHQMCGSIHN